MQFNHMPDIQVHFTSTQHSAVMSVWLPCQLTALWLCYNQMPDKWNEAALKLYDSPVAAVMREKWVSSLSVWLILWWDIHQGETLRQTDRAFKMNPFILSHEPKQAEGRRTRVESPRSVYAQMLLKYHIIPGGKLRKCLNFLVLTGRQTLHVLQYFGNMTFDMLHSQKQNLTTL